MPERSESCCLPSSVTSAGICSQSGAFSIVVSEKNIGWKVPMQTYLVVEICKLDNGSTLLREPHLTRKTTSF
ncbi:hypothetical protein L917_19162 [Phytophthora nicotianae]|uniref:Uncharacterized protein n=5 Tax=Phytophthora nicotianae TaxID=4792 RepID=W2PKG0_PHYN3|nr:hypothetical protein PPTG_24223 [Phytophthora nicotianae INRA-310]ETK73668.1 hypothetical protein L915_19431 [Phytophthora nicotianae]ETL80341.1 hypothetical protein L917_19162 [Phytophthora nicotianae]ETM33579.1 hypothetical protein L914_19205 [Phytophthora nicotianae]ETN00734.1 hypothetical protein PPTG_24223 [Phytophthora nicotianae INRA-310]